MIIYNIDKGKRDYNLEKSTNYSKLAREKFLYLPYHPLPDLSDFIGEIIEVSIYLSIFYFRNFIYLNYF